MRSALVHVHGQPAATLAEAARNREYALRYNEGYAGRPISLTLPIRSEPYVFDRFPPFFDGLLPEGAQLEALLRVAKVDRNDPMGQLLTVGGDLVGAVTVEPMAGTSDSADADHVS
jgi:serine/threonine-protein kinase HipA